MILDATTKSIEIILAEAHTTNSMPVTVDYVDLTTTTTTAGSSDTASNGTTAVTVVAAPAASTQRKVNSISVYNADTVSHVTTIRLNNNTTLRTITKVTLGMGDTLIYVDTKGWFTTDLNGNIKTIAAISIAPAFSATGTTACTATVLAKSVLNSVVFDNTGAFDGVTNYRFIPKVNGLYQFGASVAAGSTATTLELYLYKNGSLLAVMEQVNTNAATIGSVAAASANGTTDYFEFFIKSGATQNCITYAFGYLIARA